MDVGCSTKQSINWALLELYDELWESQGSERKESGCQKQQILHQGAGNLQFVIQV